MKNLINKFFAWYNRYYLLNISIALFLFLLQLVHLYWLAADVIAFKLIGQQFYPVSGLWYKLLLLVDYTEIPALITTALIYVNELRKKGYHFKSVLFIALLLSQFLHIFWITDEFVLEQFNIVEHASPHLPLWLAWIAILIDYLEVPVIIDTTKRLIDAIRKNNYKELKKALEER